MRAPRCAPRSPRSSRAGPGIGASPSGGPAPTWPRSVGGARAERAGSGGENCRQGRPSRDRPARASRPAGRLARVAHHHRSQADRDHVSGPHGPVLAAGGVEALLIRSQLAVPDNTLIDPGTYNGLVSMHGSTMIFLVLVPVWAGFGNYLVPLMIGARDMAFPRLNALSFWLLFFAGTAFYTSLVFEPPQAGWTSYAPLSDDAHSPGGGVDAWIFMVHPTSLWSLLGAINFVATIHNMRAPGMSWGRLPLFIWTILVYSYLLIIALPSLTAAVTMLLTDRHFGTAFFDPTGGGDPLLWQHLFWFFGHPEVYIMVLPAFGMISEILPVFARKPIFGYRAIAASTVAIAFLGMLVWAHHMFATPTATVVLAFFMLSSFTIAVPTGIKIFNWIATLWKGSIVFKTPFYFAAALPGLFVIGGISGVILAIFPVDWQLHDTYFVVAHLHYVLFGGSVFGIFAGLYYW